MSKVVPFKQTNGGQPNTVNGKVPPRRQRNKDVRSREYLTADEVDALMLAAGRIGRHRHRDKTLILIGYRHGLRVSELISLRWDQIDLKQGHLHVKRLKNGTPSTHPIRGPEIRALRYLKREYPKSPYLFVTERGGPMTSYTGVNKEAYCDEPFHRVRSQLGYRFVLIGQDIEVSNYEKFSDTKDIGHDYWPQFDRSRSLVCRETNLSKRG